jgi:hypothetical protein
MFLLSEYAADIADELERFQQTTPKRLMKGILPVVMFGHALHREILLETNDNNSCVGHLHCPDYGIWRERELPR